MMTNLQPYLAVCVSCFTIVVALVVSTVQVWNIRAEMAGLRSDLRGEIFALRSDVRQIWQRSDRKLLRFTH